MAASVIFARHIVTVLRQLEFNCRPRRAAGLHQSAPVTLCKSLPAADLRQSAPVTLCKSLPAAGLHQSAPVTLCKPRSAAGLHQSAPVTLCKSLPAADLRQSAPVTLCKSLPAAGLHQSAPVTLCKPRSAAGLHQSAPVTLCKQRSAAGLHQSAWTLQVRWCHNWSAARLGASGQRRLLLAFTCKVCGERVEKTISRQAYQQGVVLVQCGGCQNRHLIADRLGWFSETPGRDVEEILALRGERVVRTTAPHQQEQRGEEEVVEYLPSGVEDKA